MNNVQHVCGCLPMTPRGKFFPTNKEKVLMVALVILGLIGAAAGGYLHIEAYPQWTAFAMYSVGGAFLVGSALTVLVRAVKNHMGNRPLPGTITYRASRKLANQSFSKKVTINNFPPEIKELVNGSSRSITQTSIFEKCDLQDCHELALSLTSAISMGRFKSRQPFLAIRFTQREGKESGSAYFENYLIFTTENGNQWTVLSRTSDIKCNTAIRSKWKIPFDLNNAVHRTQLKQAIKNGNGELPRDSNTNWYINLKSS